MGTDEVVPVGDPRTAPAPLRVLLVEDNELVAASLASLLRRYGHRVDVAGNVWSGSTAVPGYMGVTVWNPAGKCIGRIRLPETCANVTFCGPKRDWLWMCASQSVYLVRLGIQGAAPG